MWDKFATLANTRKAYLSHKFNWSIRDSLLCSGTKKKHLYSNCCNTVSPILLLFLRVMPKLTAEEIAIKDTARLNELGYKQVCADQSHLHNVLSICSRTCMFL